LNLGGPQRVTRFEMGEIVCRLFGFSTDLLNPTQMADINLPATRPQDCSFDISLAQSLLKTELLNFTEGIKRSFQ
ncbi:MAG: sugar nucleotide-binding protein, partial [candidate division Zixibacteria bacterium]|nr:sugar nucleotide-binding protein [Gammaproteobacteria bacterium]NIX59893.1 sugar nucleotide-binding protein [candidate division Zixibacteria bacterium]